MFSNILSLLVYRNHDLFYGGFAAF